MPIFKEYVQEARDQLLAEPELLHEMARASIFFKQMKKLMEDNGIPERWPNYMCDPELEEQFDQALWNVSFFEASIEWIASGLGLTLPMANIPQDNIVPPTARAFIANMATILSAARASRVTP